MSSMSSCTFEESQTSDTSLLRDKENAAPQQTPVLSKLPVSTRKKVGGNVSSVSSNGRKTVSGKKGENRTVAGSGKKPLAVVNQS